MTVESLHRPPLLRRSLWAIAAAAVVAVAAVVGYALVSKDPADRRAQVASRGARVMPFDLERTTHIFRPTGRGGVQTVVADNPRDLHQIALIRQHLRDEVQRFRAGDFSDPAFIHGDDMPGLAQLRAATRDIEIRFAPVASGGRITYSTDDPELVRALHVWFDAQTMDHGRHARRSHQM